MAENNSNPLLVVFIVVLLIATVYLVYTKMSPAALKPGTGTTKGKNASGSGSGTAGGSNTGSSILNTIAGLLGGNKSGGSGSSGSGGKSGGSGLSGGSSGGGSGSGGSSSGNSGSGGRGSGNSGSSSSNSSSQPDANQLTDSSADQVFNDGSYVESGVYYDVNGNQIGSVDTSGNITTSDGQDRGNVFDGSAANNIDAGAGFQDDYPQDYASADNTIGTEDANNLIDSTDNGIGG